MKTSTFVLFVILFVTLFTIVTASKYNFGTRNDTFCVILGNSNDYSNIRYCVPVLEDDTPLRSYLDNVAKNVDVDSYRNGRKIIRALINGEGDDFKCNSGWFNTNNDC